MILYYGVCVVYMNWLTQCQLKHLSKAFEQSKQFQTLFSDNYEKLIILPEK